MNLLVDNQLPRSLATHLRTLGHGCEHVLDVGLSAADDLTVWRHADANKQILISKDEDFVFLASRPNDTGRLIWVRLGNCRNAPLSAAFDRLNVELIRAFDAGQRVVEVR
jgi:predicted nuclease of predicted toxin-antitoxin system